MGKDDKVRLTKDGLFYEKWSKKHDDYVLSGIRAGGYKKGEFFWQNRNNEIVVDKDVTLLSLITALAKMNTDELHALSLMANAHLAPYLIDFADNPDPVKDEDGFGKLKAIEIYKSIEFDNYTSGEDLFRFSSYTCAHGVGEVWSDAKDKECNTYAIEFMAWQKMLDLPIRIRKNFYFTEMVWKKCKPKKMSFGVIGSKRKVNFGTSNREIVERKVDKKIHGSMTMEEFFTGLFNELCFFESPKVRKAEDSVIKTRMEDVDKALEKEKEKKE